MFNETPDAFAFPRYYFPMEFRGHTLESVTNILRPAGSRLDYHLTLQCKNCDREETVRGRLPYEDSSSEWRAAVIKLILLGHFADECTKTDRKVYYGGV